MADEYASTRVEARKRGDVHYWTGRPCKRGHVATRYVSDKDCSQCAYERQRRRCEESPEKERERSRRQREADPEKHRKKAKKWQAKNRDYCLGKDRDRKRAYYQNEPQKYRDRANRWRQHNREKVRVIQQAARGRRRATTKEGMSTAAFREWEAAQEKTCFYCNADCADGWHLDHIQPLSKGGEHQPYNLAIACKACNLRKSDRDPEEFIDEILRAQ